MRLYGIPEPIGAATRAFDDLEGGGGQHRDPDHPGRHPGGTDRAGWTATPIETVNNYSKLSLPREESDLLLEFHGTEASTKEQAEMVWADRRGKRRRRLPPGPRQDRGADEDVAGSCHDAAWAAKAAASRAGACGPRDVCVPISAARRNASSRRRSDIVANDLLRADRGACRRRQFPSHHDGRTRTIRLRPRRVPKRSTTA